MGRGKGGMKCQADGFSCYQHYGDHTAPKLRLRCLSSGAASPLLKSFIDEGILTIPNLEAYTQGSVAEIVEGYLPPR